MEQLREGHRKRIKEKYLKNGIDGFLDYEIIELLLTFSIPRKDCKPAAKEIVKKFGTIRKFLDSDKNEICEIPDVGENTYILIKLIKDIIVEYARDDVYAMPVISSTGELLTYLKAEMKGLSKEVFKILLLDSGNRLISDYIISEGTLDRSHIYPREIIEKVIYYKAKSVIFAHNHPSGRVEPSEADKNITLKLMRVLEDIEVRLLDHIIISKTGYYSFLENGII